MERVGNESRKAIAQKKPLSVGLCLCEKRQHAIENDLHKPTLDLSLSDIAPEGIEPPTFGLGNRCSVLLSYGATITYKPFARFWCKRAPFRAPFWAPKEPLSPWFRAASYRSRKTSRSACATMS